MLLVRGPYYNGVLGSPWIDNITDGNIMLVADGIRLAPAFPLAEKLLANGNKGQRPACAWQSGKSFVNWVISKNGPYCSSCLPYGSLTLSADICASGLAMHQFNRERRS